MANQSIIFDQCPPMDKPLARVLVVTNMYPNDQAPFLGVFVREQVASLRSRGIAADLLFVNGPGGRMNYLKGIPAFWKTIRRTKYDLIHAHYVFAGWIARLQRKTPVIVTFHSGEFYSGRLESTLSLWLAPRVARNLVVSPALKAFLPGHDAWVVPCGVDTDRFVPMDRAEAREKLGLPQDKELVLFAAARRPEKRFDLVETAAELLKAKRPNAELFVLSGQPPERVPMFMNACDVLVLASDKEGSPQVVKEALACNLPVVSTRVGDVAEVIGDLDGCYLTSQDPQEIADKLAMSLDRHARTNGRQRALDLSLGAIADRLVDIYQTVMAPQGTLRSSEGQAA